MLSGCAGPRTISSTVQSYSELTTVPPGATYRFEPLPLEKAAAQALATLEGMAAQALAKVGLVQTDNNPRFAVQIDARVARQDVYPYPAPYPYPYADPWVGWRVGVGLGPRWAPYPGFGIGYYDFLPPPPPHYQREVNLVLRERDSGKVVYQSRAISDSGWWDSETVLPAMFDAALQGFPTPPAGVRRVEVPLDA